MIPRKASEVIVIDEIGKMECFYPLFRAALIQVLNSRNRVLGSIALKGDMFVKSIKTRPDVQLIHVNEKNRNNLVDAFFYSWSA
jgi:nucleoside-triphosphatase THEP1